MFTGFSFAFSSLAIAILLAGPERAAPLSWDDPAFTLEQKREYVLQRIREGEEIKNQLRKQNAATLTISSIDATGMDIELKRGDTLLVALRFAPNGDGTMRPEFGSHPVERGIYGPSISGLNPPAMPREMLPWSEFAARTAHDEVTLIVDGEDGAIIMLWKEGAVIGTYVALAPEQANAFDAESGPQAVMQSQSMRARFCEFVCNKCFAGQNPELYCTLCGRHCLGGSGE